MRIPLMIAALMLVTGASRPAVAQEAKFGVTMGYPTAVGVLWQVHDRVAVRPEFSWTHESFDDGGTFSGTAIDASGVNVAVSALVTVHQWGAVRSYVAPRFAATRTSFETTFTLSAFPPGFPLGGLTPQTVTQTTTNTNTTYEGGGSIGVQASPAPHLGVFGEVGVMYGRTRSKEDASVLQTETSTTRGSTAGIRSAVGVILFF